MTLTHSQVATAADVACQIERTLNYSQVGPKARYDWLTEIELCARLRQELLRAGKLPAEWVRLNAQGRMAPGATNHDVEIGSPLTCAIETVYCRAAAAPYPAKPLADDLQWMLAGLDRYVVAFFPRMRCGYRIQKHSTPYDLNGQSIAESLIENLLCDCLQVGGLGAVPLSLCNGIFDEVGNPVAGSAKRWSLSALTPQATKITVSGVTVERTMSGTPVDNMWAITWSRQ